MLITYAPLFQADSPKLDTIQYNTVSQFPHHHKGFRSTQKRTISVLKEPVYSESLSYRQFQEVLSVYIAPLGHFH